MHDAVDGPESNGKQHGDSKAKIALQKAQALARAPADENRIVALRSRRTLCLGARHGGMLELHKLVVQFLRCIEQLRSHLREPIIGRTDIIVSN